MQKKYLIAGVVALAAVLLLGVIILNSGGSDSSTTSEAVVSEQVEGDSTLPSNITPQQYQSEFVGKNTSHFLVDVRTPEEYAEGHISDSVNISLQTLGNNLDQIPTDQPVVLYCRSGNRSAQAADLLRAAGYTQVYDLGGIIDWQAAGYEVEK